MATDENARAQNTAIANHLRGRKSELGYTYEVLEALTGIPASSLKKLLRDRAEFRMGEVYRVAVALGQQPDEALADIRGKVISE